MIAHAAAKAAGGRFLLRIEDIDQTRSRPEYEAAILEDLAWLGLDWEEPVRRQSEHMDDYRRALDRLIARGLVYRCFRTRREILDDIGQAPHGPGEAFPRARPCPRPRRKGGWRRDSPSPGGCRWTRRGRLWVRTPGRSCRSWRKAAGPNGEHGLIKARPELAGDVVLARKDVGVAYHLAVVVDDALQGVTHVIRGEDLHEAAHIQRLLQALLDLPAPIYRHHRLLLGPDGKRLAKRDRAQTLAEIRESGITAAALRAELGF